MWLLDTKTLKLEEFQKDIPNYAILFHRWEEREEVSFENVEKSPNHRKGYRKVKSFCRKARMRGFAYVWVDTCCIDKKSSAELNEAINSMYKWYERAAICYVYLSDVSGKEDIAKSSWFTRGWTLQELLAPSKLHFFNCQWAPISSRKRLAAKLERDYRHSPSRVSQVQNQRLALQRKCRGLPVETQLVKKIVHTVS